MTLPQPAPRNRPHLLAVGLCLLLPMGAGCAGFRPIHGIPARYIAPDIEGVSRSGKRTIDLSLLRQTPPAEYRLDAGDVLGIYIEGVLGKREEVPPVHFPLDKEVPPSLGYPIPVRDDGSISLPLIEPIDVRGMTIRQMEETIRSAYTQDQNILQPGRDRILVSLQKPRTYGVLVIRQETGGSVSSGIQLGGGGQLNIGDLKRGSGKLVNLPAYKNDVLHALAETGGLPGLDAENAIYIIRNQPQGVAGQETKVESREPKKEAVRQTSGIGRGQVVHASAQVPAADAVPPAPSGPVTGLAADAPNAWGHSASPAFPPFSKGGRYGVAPAPPGMIPYNAPPASGPAPHSQPPAFPHQTPAWGQQPLPVPGGTSHRYADPVGPSPALPVPMSAQPTWPQQQPWTPQQPPPWPAHQPFPPHGPMPEQQQWSEQFPGQGPSPQFHVPGSRFQTPLQQPGGESRRDNVVRIPVRLAPGEDVHFSERDIILHDGDIVFIESRETEIFYTGGLLGGGQFTIPRDYDLDVLGAVSIAQSGNNAGSSPRSIGGTSALNQDVTISASDVIILRQLPNGTQVPIKVDLYQAMRNPEERILVQPGDYVILQYKPAEAFAAFIERHLLEGALLGIAASQFNTTR